MKYQEIDIYEVKNNASGHFFHNRSGSSRLGEIAYKNIEHKVSFFVESVKYRNEDRRYYVRKHDHATGKTDNAHFDGCYSSSKAATEAARASAINYSPKVPPVTHQAIVAALQAFDYPLVIELCQRIQASK